MNARIFQYDEFIERTITTNPKPRPQKVKDECYRLIWYIRVYDFM